MSQHIILRHIGLEIQRRRRYLGLSQEELAARAGFDRTYISLVESGKRNLSFLNLCRFAWALEVPPANLVQALPWEKLCAAGLSGLEVESGMEEQLLKEKHPRRLGKEKEPLVWNGPFFYNLDNVRAELSNEQGLYLIGNFDPFSWRYLGQGLLKDGLTGHLSNDNHFSPLRAFLRDPASTPIFFYLELSDPQLCRGCLAYLLIHELQGRVINGDMPPTDVRQVPLGLPQPADFSADPRFLRRAPEWT